MKRSGPRKKRRIETYAHPVVFRDVLPLIARHCDMQSFARLKRVCKSFREWLPEHHPLVRFICRRYDMDHRAFPYYTVSLLFDAYWGRFRDSFPDAAKNRIVLIDEPYEEDGEIGVMRCDGGIWDCMGFTGRHIFEDKPWQHAQIRGCYNVAGSCLAVDHVRMTHDDSDE